MPKKRETVEEQYYNSDFASEGTFERVQAGMYKNAGQEKETFQDRLVMKEFAAEQILYNRKAIQLPHEFPLVDEILKRGQRIAYITNSHEELKPRRRNKCRIGGFLVSKDITDDINTSWIALKNAKESISWSVQLRHIKYLYFNTAWTKDNMSEGVIHPLIENENLGTRRRKTNNNGRDRSVGQRTNFPVFYTDSIGRKHLVKYARDTHHMNTVLNSKKYKETVANVEMELHPVEVQQAE